MSEVRKDYKVNTFNQELLQCVALSFFTRNQNATDESFFEYIKIMQDSDNVLKGVFAEYELKTNLEVFNTTSEMGISWVKSSIDIAKFLIKKLNLNDSYDFYHQKSTFGKLIKDNCIKRLVEDLDLKKYSDEPDTYNPTDVWIVKRAKKTNIETRLKEKIIEADTGTVTKNYISNRHTYKSIIGGFFRTKSLYQISLKKASESGGVKYKVIGSLYGIDDLDIDPYTKFISIIDDIINENSKPKLEKFISDLVLLRKINYKDETLQPNVTFTLRYGQLDVADKVLGMNETWKLDTPGNTFNMQKLGGTAWSGGLNFNGIHLALKNYSEYMPVFREMKQLRYRSFEELYKKLFPNKKVPTNITHILLRQDEIIYKKEHLSAIESALGNEQNYKQFLTEAIIKLSGPYRGQKSLYGVSVTGSMDIQTTIKDKDTNIETVINRLKLPSEATALIISPIKKNDKTISFTAKTDYKQIRGRLSSIKNIKKGDIVFVRKFDANGKEVGSALASKTKVERINFTKKTITLSKPIESGGGAKVIAVIFNPVQTNILSNDKLAATDRKKLEEKFSKLQPFWMFMRGGPKKLREFLKKQIVLTIYGLVSKKGGKIFEHDFTKDNTIGKKLRSKNALEKYIIPQFIIVGD